jgi:AraC-like DNA-binding protein
MLLHLIPLVAVGIHRTIVNPVSIGSLVNPGENTMYFYNKIYYSLIVVSLLCYWIFSLKLILNHRKNIPNQFSNYTSKNSLDWLVSVLTLFLVLFVMDFSMSFMNRVLGFEIVRFSFLSLNLTIFTFIMIFFGINQSAIYKKHFATEIESEVNNDENIQETKHTRSTLNEKQIEELTKTVFQYLKSKKPYLNPDYSLQMMADDLNISRHKLSEVINSGQKKNFYKLINEFRIEEVKEMLINPKFKHYTVLGIGLECGFNSKTSFNRIFKEETGFTPTEYKRTV